MNTRIAAMAGTDSRTSQWAIPGWLMAVLILIGTAALGPSLGSLSRPGFVIDCGVVGWLAWRRGPAPHLQAALVLFAFAPLVRRTLDLQIGYDQLGLMLIGPLLAILVPALDLPQLLERRAVPQH